MSLNLRELAKRDERDAEFRQGQLPAVQEVERRGLRLRLWRHQLGDAGRGRPDRRCLGIGAGDGVAGGRRGAPVGRRSISLGRAAAM